MGSDGMTIDSEDRLWIAFCHGGCVSCFDPGTGDELHRISLPCLETTACAFGGPDLTDLFVTTGVHKTAKEEHAGRLFVIRGLKVKGVPADELAAATTENFFRLFRKVPRPQAADTAAA